MKWNLPAHVQVGPHSEALKGRVGGKQEEEEEKEPRCSEVYRGRQHLKGQLTRKKKGKYDSQWAMLYLHL